MDTQIRSVGIVAKPRLTAASPLIHQLVDWLEARQLKVWMDCETASIVDHRREWPRREELPEKCDLLIVLGGDGTLLSIARLLGRKGPPVLAVNFGSLGFLAEITLGEIFSTLDDFMLGQISTQPRMMIEIAVIRQGKAFASYRALNDAVLTKGTLARIIDIEVKIDRNYVATYKADGLIISTPTGSTAYTLSAGGPIVHPSLAAMLVTPIASHTLTIRPLVIPDHALVEMSFKPTCEAVFLTVDGQIGIELQAEDVVQVCKSEVMLDLIPSSTLSFFDILRQKLKWGER
jgi:NAD+ kinase